MNSTEARYEQEILLQQLRAGEIQSYQFEKMKFKIGDNCWYTPDFVVVTDIIEVHEVKGGLIRDDAVVKFKAAADQYPYFRFVMAQYKGKTWSVIRDI